MRTIGLIAIIFFIVIMNLAASYILPYPFSKMNILFVLLLLFLFWRESGKVVWLSFFTHIIIEFYALTPFGIILFSGTISMLFTYWIYQNIFTNKSIYSVLALSIFAVIIYRFFYMFLLFLFNFFSGSSESIPLLMTMQTFGWEILFTVLSVSTVYLFATQISKPFTRLRRRVL